VVHGVDGGASRDGGADGGGVTGVGGGPEPRVDGAERRERRLLDGDQVRPAAKVFRIKPVLRSRGSGGGGDRSAINYFVAALL
jgi:hypothetical protein